MVMETASIELIKAVGEGGGLVLIAWLIFHTFRHTIPRLANSFDKTNERLVDRFSGELKEQRKEFITELKEQRQADRAERHQANTELREMFRSIDAKLDRVLER